MAHRLALQASEQVAAFGAVAGALPSSLREVQPTHAVSALLINGTADQLVPIGGGYSRHDGPNGEPRGRILSQHDTTEHWRAVNRCGSGPDFETVEETPPSPDRPDWLGLTRHIITGGVGGTKVATLTVHGGGTPGPDPRPGRTPRPRRRSALPPRTSMPQRKLSASLGPCPTRRLGVARTFSGHQSDAGPARIGGTSRP